MDIEKLMLSVCDLCIDVGVFVKQQTDILETSQIEFKGRHDMVSYIDRSAEEKIIAELKKLLPESGFIAEESGEMIAEKYNWIIDPIDGTTNYVHHVPIFSISIALQRDNEIILGVVYEINQKECFYACEGGGAFMNGKNIHVSSHNQIDDCMIGTGFPYSDFSKLKPYMALLEDMLQNARGVRRLGSAAVDLAYVASGRYDVYFEYALHPWDVAAGAFIVKQAGGNVTNFDGGDDPIFGRSILAGTPNIHKILREKIDNYFGLNTTF